MKLYVVHCGFYDPSVCDAVFESHVTLMSFGATVEEAKKNVRLLPVFQEKKMHVDGIQEINHVGGYAVELKPGGAGQNVIPHLHRDF